MMKFCDMKKIRLAICLSLLLPWCLTRAEEKKIRVFDSVVFYDGYLQEVVEAGLDDGVLRFSNSLYSTRLDPSELAGLGDKLTMSVTIGALCDNYDRLGNVNLAFVPKGSGKYEYGEVERIELTRFVTPFMNMNRYPREVPYEYDISNISRLLRDKDLNEKYDFWLEMEVFGIPYAANAQIAGCSDRNDVFEGTVDLIYTPVEESGELAGNVIVPIFVKQPENYGNVNFNNYKEGATDTLGVTTRSFEFEVPQDVTDSRVYLILTNHGAGDGGEEYIRRMHIVYCDDDVVLSYVPGGVSCEPYRRYNTQTNGIYGTKARSEAEWASFSNWCPGQAVPIREIHTGARKAGKHKVMIRVPDAVFYGKDGDFRPSLYFQGVTEGTLPAGVEQQWVEGAEIKISRHGDTLNFSSDEEISRVVVHSVDGKLLDIAENRDNVIDLKAYSDSLLILTFLTPDGRTSTRQILNP